MNFGNPIQSITVNTVGPDVFYLGRLLIIDSVYLFIYFLFIYFLLVLFISQDLQKLCRPLL